MSHLRRRIAVVTDSAANLPRAMVQQLLVRVVPLWIAFRDGVFRDGVDLSAAQFYRRLREGQLASTSQPNPEAFLEAYRQIQASPEGEDLEGILVVTLSSKLSGTFESARQAAESFAGATVRVIDSLTTAFAEGWLVVEAVRLADAGASLGRIADRLLRLRERAKLFGAVDTLEYLRRLGRIGRAAAMAGTLLKVKPIVTVARDGVVEARDRVRTLEHALERMVDLTTAEIQGARTRVAVLHADAREAAERLYEKVQARLPCSETVLDYLTPVIGAHAGPGTVGLAFLPEEEAPATAPT